MAGAAQQPLSLGHQDVLLVSELKLSQDVAVAPGT